MNMGGFRGGGGGFQSHRGSQGGTGVGTYFFYLFSILTASLHLAETAPEK